MSPNPMGWWYWFGMQIFGIASLVLTWWLFLDASRRKGTPMRFIWPIISLAGLLMQIPAFAVSQANQATGTGTSAAILGVFGLIVVSLAAITHFYKSPASGGTGWSMRTRDENSSSRSTSDRRRTHAPQASVAVGQPESRRSGRTAPAGVPSPVPASASRQPAPQAAPAAPATAARVSPAAAPPSGAAPATPSAHASVTAPVAAEHTETGDTTASDAELPTIAAEPGLTVTDEPAETLTDEREDAAPVAAVTVCDDVARTIVDEPSTIINEQDADPQEEYPAGTPRLTITDGRSSRIIISDHSGPFVVGREPSKCSLAVDDARASRAHFSIAERDGQYYIRDLGSSNGTFVNGALVQDEMSLKAGDTIEFGRTVAVFEIPE